MKLAKATRKVGDIFAIPLAQGFFGFGQVAVGKDIGFFDYRSMDMPIVDDLILLQLAFRVPVGSTQQKVGGWFSLTNTAPVGALADLACYRHRPVLSKQTYIFCGGVSTPSSEEITEKLEDYAMWSAFHIVSRLEDHFAGRENEYVNRNRNRAF